ncbi:MAG: hypothetical protein P9L94_00455 [Candidatus Hinthialibacter antarcticus]|nr:hypothetical protein [Candidatus Hinthialibacter antarcticus]
MQPVTWTQFKEFTGRGYLWPVLFWGWVVAMSFYIERAPVHDPRALPSSLAYSGISFEGLRFEQLGEDGGRIIVNAPSAYFNQTEKKFLLDSPELAWDNPAAEESFKATGATGQFQVETNVSALPSEFNRMQLNGGASAQSGQTAVDADRLVFDNELLLFEVLGSYELRIRASKSKRIDPQGALYFDPIQEKINQNKETLLSARKPKP